MTFFDDSGINGRLNWESAQGDTRLEDAPRPNRVPSQIVQMNDLRSNRQASPHAQLSGSDSEASFAKASVQLRRRESLVIQHDQLWEVEQGFIKALTWDDQGCTLTLGLWGPGDLVGLPLGNIAPYQCICITPVRVRSLTLRGGYPHRFLYEQARQSQELLSLFRCRCLETRLLDVLWWLSNRFGQQLSTGQLTGIPLTHQELADLLGSTRVTMTRMLRELEQAGELQRQDRRQIILTGQPRNLGIRPVNTPDSF